jgi:CheY-like chemotaxis protein
VSDTGVGIPAEKQHLIFEQFSQADASTTRKYGGTGLGLTIASRLTEMMGGRIKVESEVGKGSRFQLFIPMAVSDTPTKSLWRGGSCLEGIRVLVVDDHCLNRILLVDLLGQWLMSAVAVDSPAAAAAALRSATESGTPFRLILLDSTLPGVDTIHLSKQIHSIFPSVAIVTLGVAGKRRDATQLREAEIAASVVKPARPSELRDALVSALGLRIADQRVQTQHSASQKSLQPMHILLAEDNPVNQRLAVILIEKHGDHVQVAANGYEVLNALKHRRFDLVLMDVQMPEMDGLEATAAIRETEKVSGGHLPILAMTAHAMASDRERCLQAGMDGYLGKPIHPEELRMAIDVFRAQARDFADPCRESQKSTQSL